MNAFWRSSKLTPIARMEFLQINTECAESTVLMLFSIPRAFGGLQTAPVGLDIKQMENKQSKPRII